MLENHIKSLIQYCERSELRLQFIKMPKTVLPDRYILTEQKLAENGKINKKIVKLLIFGIFDKLLSTQNVNVARFARNIEGDFFCDFQTPCIQPRERMKLNNEEKQSPFSYP